MESVNVHLHKATDAEAAYALSLDDVTKPWRAERGYGSTWDKIWTVELQSNRIPDLETVDWDAVLERVIEACDLNDPVIADFEWPLRQLA
jgi:hypothetical protein